MSIDWDAIPVLSVRQDSLEDQMNDLIRAANRLGLYDASDWVACARRDYGLRGHKAEQRTAPAVPTRPQAHAKPTKPTRGAA